MIARYIKSDLCRYVGRDNITFTNFVRHYLFNSGFKFTFWLRVAQKSPNFILRYIGYIQHYRLQHKYDLFIPVRTQIGYGFGIGHGRSVFINATAKLGNNVTVSQFVTIGSNYSNAATIGDNVNLAPNVCVVENVNIGNNVRVGAGAVVTRDLPDLTVCVGIPAKVIKTFQLADDKGLWIVSEQ